MPTYNFKQMKVVPTAKDFIDIVLSKTQRQTPTQNHAGWHIARIRQFYMRKVKFSQQSWHDRLGQILEDFPKVRSGPDARLLNPAALSRHRVSLSYYFWDANTRLLAFLRYLEVTIPRIVSQITGLGAGRRHKDAAVTPLRTSAPSLKMHSLFAVSIDVFRSNIVATPVLTGYAPVFASSGGPDRLSSAGPPLRARASARAHKSPRGTSVVQRVFLLPLPRASAQSRLG